MSDDDAAEKKNIEAEETAKTDKTVEPETSAKDESAKESAEDQSAPAAEGGEAKGDTEGTVQLPSASAQDAKAGDETVKSAASAQTPESTPSSTEAAASASADDDDKTVKLPTAEPAAATAPADPPTPKASSESKSIGLVPIVAAFSAGVVVVAAVAAAVVFGIQSHDRGSQIDARNSAVAAACDFGHQVGTYDSAKFDDYIKRVKDRSTGDWLTQFDGASTALKQITQQAQARSTVGEIHCAYESGDSKKASVVMLITQEQSKAATPAPQPLTIGVVASLQKKDGKWLVNNFESPMTNDMQGGGAPAPGANAQQPPAPSAPQPGPGN